MKKNILLLTLFFGTFGLHGQFINNMISRQGRMLVSYVEEVDWFKLILPRH